MIIDSPIISGSYLSTGSLSQTGNVSITGSLTATAGITGSFTGSLTGIATSASYASFALTSSYSLGGSGFPFSGSAVITGSLLVSGSAQITGSLSVSGSVSASLFGTASQATSASYSYTASSAVSASYSQTASYLLGYISPFPYTGSAAITGSLIVTGSLTVSTLVTSSGVRYVIADANGLISAQTASAAVFVTQKDIATAAQTSFNIVNGYSTGYVTVFVNGTKLSADEYTDTSGTAIVLATGSMVNDVVEFQKYMPAAGVSNNVLRTTNYFTTTLGQTNFTVNYTPGLLDVFYNGSKLNSTEYTAANGTSITLATGSNLNDSLEVDVYSYQVGAFSGIGGVGVAKELAFYNTTNSITGSNKVTYDGSTFSITGSFLVTGSSTFTNIGPAVFSGSVTAVGGFSGSFSGNADSASLAQNSLLLEGTGSVGFTTTASFLAVSSSQQQISASQQQLSSSFLALTASFNAVSASQQQISSSYIALSGSYNTFSGSASTRITVDSASIQQVSSSQQQISASLLNVIAIGATTGSNSFRATQSITGSLTVTGQIIAQTLNVQQVTSSIIYSSGSNNFGCDLNSRQTFTGSVLITGSLTIAGASSATSYSGTTIYGSTAVCSTVGKFTSCIDAGSGTFSGCVLIGKTTSAGGRLQVSNGTVTFNVDHNADGPYLTGATDNNVNYRKLSYDASEHIFLISATEKMRITSGGLVSINQTGSYGIFNVTGIDCGWGEGIILNPAPNGYSAINYRLEGRTGSCYTCAWQLGKEASSSGVGELFSLNKQGLTGGKSYRVDASQQWKTNGDSIFGFNVGMGTCGPNARLTVWTPSTTGMQTALRLNNPFGFTNANTGAKIVFSQDRNCSEDYPTAEIGAGQEVGATSSYGYLAFSTLNTTMSEKVRITAAGLVGIGTCAPDYPLTVKTDASANSIKILGRSGGDTSVSWNSSDNATQYAHIDIGAAYSQLYSNSNLQIFACTNQATAGAYNTFGNLYVASTSSQGIDIGGSISIGGKYNGSSYATFARIQGKKENSSSGQTGGYLAFEVATDATNLNTERMRIVSSGNVGIGTTTPYGLMDRVRGVSGIQLPTSGLAALHFASAKNGSSVPQCGAILSVNVASLGYATFSIHLFGNGTMLNGSSQSSVLSTYDMISFVKDNGGTQYCISRISSVLNNKGAGDPLLTLIGSIVSNVFTLCAAVPGSGQSSYNVTGYMLTGQQGGNAGSQILTVYDGSTTSIYCS